MEQKFLNLDEGQSIFFARELEHVLSRTHDIVYPSFKARLFIPVNSEAGPGADSITYYQFDKVGMAKIIADYASDLPRANAFGEKFTSPVESIGISFGYSLQEVRSSAMANRSLPMMQADAARRGHEEAVDEIGAFGDATTGLTGFLNNANVPTGSAVNGGWAAATADQIIEDLNEMVTSIIDATNSAESPNTIGLPVEMYTIINQRRIPGTEVTVAKFFLQNSPWIRNIDHWYRLKGAGAGATDRMVCYDRNPTKLELQIPLEFETLPVQEKGLTFEVPTHSRIGGVTVYKPMSIAYRDGL
jgi:hypothetical protein